MEIAEMGVSGRMGKKIGAVPKVHPHPRPLPKGEGSDSLAVFLPPFGGKNTAKNISPALREASCKGEDGGREVGGADRQFANSLKPAPRMGNGCPYHGKPERPVDGSAMGWIDPNAHFSSVNDFSSFPFGSRKWSSISVAWTVASKKPYCCGRYQTEAGEGWVATASSGAPSPPTTA